jgi:hypothetical protein
VDFSGTSQRGMRRASSLIEPRNIVAPRKVSDVRPAARGVTSDRLQKIGTGVFHLGQQPLIVYYSANAQPAIYRPACRSHGTNFRRSLCIDDFGIGTLTIGNGGMVNVGISVGVAVFPGSTRTVNTSAASGQPAAAPDTLNTSLAGFGDGTGRIVFNHTASNYTFAATLSGPGLVKVDAGSKIQTTNNTDTRATTISGGALIVNRSIASSAPLR